MLSRFGPVLTLLIVLAVNPATPAPTSAQPAEGPTDVRPLLVGHEVPDVALATSDGEATTLHAALGDGPSILVFYRGGW